MKENRIDDNVSRRVAIDALKDAINDSVVLTIQGDMYSHNDNYFGLEVALSIIQKLPSAQPTEASCWGCNCPKMERLKEQKTFSEMVHLHDAETHEERTETHGVCLDTISRRAAIDALGERPMVWTDSDYEIAQRNQYDVDKLAIETVPSVQLTQTNTDSTQGCISRQAAIDAVESAKTARTPDGEIYVAKLNAEMNIQILPSVQPEIIRCKDCKHRPVTNADYDFNEWDCGLNIEFPDYKCPCQCDDAYYNRLPGDNWFCGNAERRTNG